MTKAAIIIENRPIPGLEEIILAHEKMLPLDWQVWHIKNEPISTMDDYNKLLTSKRFWRNMPDKVLIFQHDSMLLREGIEEFLEWDYVGAPWQFQEHGGNGGLSLRDSKAMMTVLDKFEWDNTQGNEDVFFCNRLKELGMKLAPREVCSKFSCESIFQLRTLGAHAIDKWLTPIECLAITNQYLKAA